MLGIVIIEKTILQTTQRHAEFTLKNPKIRIVAARTQFCKSTTRPSPAQLCVPSPKLLCDFCSLGKMLRVPVEHMRGMMCSGFAQGRGALLQAPVVFEKRATVALQINSITLWTRYQERDMGTSASSARATAAAAAAFASATAVVASSQRLMSSSIRKRCCCCCC
jgi:hypothetical protein